MTRLKCTRLFPNFWSYFLAGTGDEAFRPAAKCALAEVAARKKEVDDEAKAAAEEAQLVPLPQLAGHIVRVWLPWHDYFGQDIPQSPDHENR